MMICKILYFIKNIVGLMKRMGCDLCLPLSTIIVDGRDCSNHEI